MADLTSEQHLWKVRLHRFMRYPAKPAGKPRREILSVLLAAATSDAAMSQGRAWGEETAPASMILVGVETMEAASVRLPYQL